MTAAAAGFVVTRHPVLARHLLGRLAALRHGSGPPVQHWDLSHVVVKVDIGGPGRPISPLIYGVSMADESTVRQLGATVDRWGGNATSRYNWVDGKASNAGRDWGFRNVGADDQRDGSSTDRFIQGAIDAGAVPLVTIPTIGWVAANGDNETYSRGVPAGGGAPLRPGLPSIRGYDPSANRAATSVPSRARKDGPFLDPPDPGSSPVYEDEWVHHLVGQFGAGKLLYAMDNEPDLWSFTHTDVHPARMGYDAMVANFEEYATAVAAEDPSSPILGPDVWGWSSYLYSDLDRGDDAYASHLDRRAHGDTDFLPWWLGQVSRLDHAAGHRVLGYLDIHYYPQAAGVYSSAADAATRALRIRSVRGLFDPGYRDESWIDAPVALIPRMRGWVDQRYPGTRLAISEYNWGGENDASGAVALAEVLGSFGRYGVDLATYWTFPPPDSPAGAAFRLYRNVDGQGSAFGDVSLPAPSSARGVEAFAARHSHQQQADVVLVNESPDTAAHVRLDVAGHTAPLRVADEYVIADSAAIQHVAPSRLDAVVLPPYSVTLVRLSW